MKEKGSFQVPLCLAPCILSCIRLNFTISCVCFVVSFCYGCTAFMPTTLYALVGLLVLIKLAYRCDQETFDIYFSTMTRYLTEHLYL